MKNNRCEQAASLQAALWPINRKLCLAADYAPNTAGRLKKAKLFLLESRSEMLAACKAPNYENSSATAAGAAPPSCSYTR